MNKTIIEKSGDWLLEVDLEGGRIKQLKNKDKIILGSFKRIDGKIGNTHLCIPNFGNEGTEKFNLPFHGPARNGDWRIKINDNNFISINYEFENLGLYPGSLQIEQQFILDDCFTHRVRVKNQGNTEAPLNIGVHNYWNTDYGWEGLKINGVDVTEVIKNDTYFEIKNKNEIIIHKGEVIDWELDGLNFVRLWSGRSEINGNLNFDNKYACIEPCIGKDNYFGSIESMLKPGEVKEVLQKIKIGGGMPDLNR